ncbi:MAG: hypothetical protein V2A34_08550 [Lentisphaerota bacterium]
MNQEWNIKSRGEACQKCSRSFADGEAFSSSLVFGEGGYSRGDFCEACWTSSPQEGTLSVWRTIFKMPAPPPDEPLKKETAESLLRELMETEDAAHRNVIFILAVMLERRRILAEKDVQVREDGVKIRVYEHKKTGETFVVPDPELKLRELETVQQEVLNMLGGKPMTQGEAVAETPAAPPAPPAE